MYAIIGFDFNHTNRLNLIIQNVFTLNSIIIFRVFFSLSILITCSDKVVSNDYFTIIEVVLLD